MASSPTSEIILSDKDYCKITTDVFQMYACANFEESSLLEAFQIDFEHWTKENWEAIDGNTWITIKQHCIHRGIWIDHYWKNGTRAEILMKLVSTTECDTELNDWDMNCIQLDEERYNNISRGIQRRKQKLLGNVPGPSTLPTPLFNETRNSPPIQQVSLQHSHIQQMPKHQGQSLSQQQPFMPQDVPNQQDHHNQSNLRSQQYNQNPL